MTEPISSFFGALVILASLLSKMVTSRLGLPLLARVPGEEGPGGILFGNIQLAHLIGSAALAVILFDGGMRNFRIALKPTLGLATVGVVINLRLTALFPWWWLGLFWLEA